MIDARGNLTVLIGTGPGSQPVASGNPLSYPLVQPVGMASDSSFRLDILEAGRVSMYSPFNPETGSAATVQTIAETSTRRLEERAMVVHRFPRESIPAVWRSR